MKTVYFVTYDIRNPKRLRLVYRMMRGFGRHLQLSVFRCELSERQLAQMRLALDVIIKHDEDQILLVDLGPPDGRAATCISSLGEPYACPQRHSVVV